jgi:hypothetical protein
MTRLLCTNFETNARSSSLERPVHIEGGSTRAEILPTVQASLLRLPVVEVWSQVHPSRVLTGRRIAADQAKRQQQS